MLRTCFVIFLPFIFSFVSFFGTDCSFDCSGDNQDKYYSNPKFCNIFHRCVDKRLYTAPCGKGAYFSTQTCVCSNIDDVIKEIGCDKDGMRLNVENVKTLCMYSTGS